MEVLLAVVQAMHDSYAALGGMMPMLNMAHVKLAGTSEPCPAPCASSTRG